MISAVPASLSRARDLVGPALRAGIERLGGDVRRVVAYHLGFTDADGRPSDGGGKALRPALAMLSAEAVAAPASVAVPGAVAVELIHNFSLLHDDVMDQDRERRHRPTAWALFGVGPAIIAGDGLEALAQQVLMDDPTPSRIRAASALDNATARMIEGQAQDLAFESRLDVSPAECLEMSANKTGALLGCAASIGAILAGGPEPAIEALRTFGLQLGLAYQAVDDVLGIWGRPEITGKPAANDLRQAKKTLPVVAALTSGTPPGDELERLLSNGHLDEADVVAAARLVEEAGGRAWTEREADRRSAMALQALERVEAPSEVRTELADVAAFVAAREF